MLFYCNRITAIPFYLSRMELSIFSLCFKYKKDDKYKLPSFNPSSLPKTIYSLQNPPIVIALVALSNLLFINGINVSAKISYFVRFSLLYQF